jgi:predicted RNase H-like HicB family nuclease
LYRAGINTSDGPAWAQVFDLPGCSSTAGTEEELESVLRLSVAEYLS